MTVELWENFPEPALKYEKPLVPSKFCEDPKTNDQLLPSKVRNPVPLMFSLAFLLKPIFLILCSDLALIAAFFPGKTPKRGAEP